MGNQTTKDAAGIVILVLLFLLLAIVLLYTAFIVLKAQMWQIKEWINECRGKTGPVNVHKVRDDIHTIHQITQVVENAKARLKAKIKQERAERKARKLSSKQKTTVAAES